MRKLFYPRLALSNIKKNRRFYLPYLLTCIGTIAGFYIMCAIATDNGIFEMRGADALQTVLIMGCIVIGLFALIFLFYTNSFLMKRRKKELGLYNILGMDKKNIARMLVWETFFMMLGGIGMGLLSGVLLNKLVVLILLKILSFDVPFGFSVSPSGIIASVILFSIIFFLNLLSNLSKIRLSHPIDLLKGSNTGEKEPKGNILLVILGILFLTAGYTIAVKVEDPISALTVYFLAVIFVILGTYCLFTSVSIAVLKLLRKNKKFYYTPRHFTTVSGMIYRMKQNAVGLANICILATMVLVMISATISLYAGVDEAVNKLYPYDIYMRIYAVGDDFNRSDVLGSLKEQAERTEAAMKDIYDYRYFSFTAGRKNNDFTLDTRNLHNTQTSVLCFFTSEEYAYITGNEVQLEKGEILLHTKNTDFVPHEIQIDDIGFTVKSILEDFPHINQFGSYIYPIYYIVVPDTETYCQIMELQRQAYGEYAGTMRYDLYFNLSGSDEAKRQFVNTVREEGGISVDYESLFIDEKLEGYDQAYHLYGGFLFLGIFLGLIFTMAAVLIIYYKQISEGYEDKERFEIMQKVGMSHEEIKRTINSQVLTVFFLPIIVACIHLAFNFNIMTKLMALLNLSNTGLFLICTLITIGVFCIIYGLVYAITSKVYYKIVAR